MRRLLLASLVLLPTVAGGRPAATVAAHTATRPDPAPTVTSAVTPAAAAAEEARLAGLRVAAAARLRDIETAAADRAAAVAALAERRDAAAARLHEHAAALAPLLPLMERLALYPAETLLAVPAAPADALRGLAVMHGIAAQLEREAAALRAEQAQLAAEGRAVDEALAALRTVQAQGEAENRALDAQLAAAQALRAHAEQAGAEAARRAATEAAHADTLRAAVSAVEAARARAEAQARDDALRAERQRQDAAAAEAHRRQDALARPSGPAPEPHGQLLTPVAGAVVQGWGARTDAGPATGVSFRAAPAARVVAPCGGRVRFAGPFRSYGALVILDCGSGYAFVLAGLDRLDVPAGAAVLPGEPVGQMPAWNPAAATPRPTLYVELRHDGQAVDPLPFLRGRG